MDIFGGDIKQFQADLVKDIPTLEAAEVRVITGAIAGLSAMIGNLIEGHTITITIQVQKK